MLAQTVFLNLEAGMSPQEITEEFDISLDQIQAVLHFASQSLAKEPIMVCSITVPQDPLPEAFQDRCRC